MLDFGILNYEWLTDRWLIYRNLFTSSQYLKTPTLARSAIVFDGMYLCECVGVCGGLWLPVRECVYVCACFCMCVYVCRWDNMCACGVARDMCVCVCVCVHMRIWKTADRRSSIGTRQSRTSQVKSCHSITLSSPPVTPTIWRCD